MADKMAQSIVDVLKENGVEKERIGIDVYDPSAVRRLRASRPEHRQRLAGDVRRAHRQDAGRDRVPEDLRARSATRRSGGSSTSGSSRASRRATSPRRSTSTSTSTGFDFVYDIIVASGGNTSPYRRWHTDKVIREGDLVIVDQNAVGPGGYFVDFVRCFKVGGRWTPKEKDLYKECYESMYAAIEMMKAGNTTADVAAQAAEVRRRRVRHRDAAAVRALDRPVALRGHVDLARVLARLPGRARGGHVLRGRDVRRATRASSRPCASRRTCSSPRTGRCIFTKHPHPDAPFA